MVGELSELESLRKRIDTQSDLGATRLSPEESVRLWRKACSCSIAAAQDALDDMAAGDRGQPLDQVTDEIRKKHGWTLGE